MNALTRIKAAVAEQWGRSTVNRVELSLPRPPSVNALYRNVPGKGRRSTKRYVQWTNEAGARLAASRPGRIAGPYTLTLTINAADRIDLDNCAKATSDLLQAHGVIDNDKLADEIRLRRADWVPLRSIHVVVEPAGRG